MILFRFFIATVPTKPQTFDLLDREGKTVCKGTKVDRTTVHGHKLTQGWHAYEITDVCDSAAQAWEGFPGEIEQGAFIAWPLSNVKTARQDKDQNKRKEALGLIDQLHPDFGESPSSLTQQPRQLRVSKKKNEDSKRHT